MRYLEKEKAILKIAAGRKLLHLGCVGFTDLDPRERIRLAKESVHWSLSQVADVVGIDSSQEIVREYKDLGLLTNVVVGNVEKLDELHLNVKFDVIVAGDIIEHVSNPGLMLEGIKRFCRADTAIIITTPHAFGLPNYLRFALGRFQDGAEHVMTFNMHNIRNLLERHDYQIQEISTCYQRFAKSYGLVFRFFRLVFDVFPRFGGTLFVVATPNWGISDYGAAETVSLHYADSAR